MACLFISHVSFTEDGQMKYWEPLKTKSDEKNPWSKDTKPIGIEATAYALLTYTLRSYVGKQ
jgi:hypothetical protein